MKRIILLLGLFLLASCNDTKEEPTMWPPAGKETPDFLSSYICYYHDCPPSVSLGSVRNGQFGFQLILESNVGGYLMPDLGSTGANAARYKEIAERNGDVSYNREEVWTKYCNRMSVADNFSSVRVVCVKGDWDATHPEGSSLNDLITIVVETYAPFIRGGYTGEGISTINKRLTDLAENDLAVISPYIELDFDNYPSRGAYELEVTLVTTDGEEKTVTYTHDFSK